ncbi:MAG: acetyl-CoA carboxylase biotin carboxyl carrier protein subunit [Prevotellaceae bacterium]|jgi:biotin carboxyl carrier protein|nr:acetyl-CoA carboxylase biotin carboxyl carrier protein subunit [Prevotellaceae bacterium]
MAEINNTELVDFAVTARKYKTLLTTKYLQRKVWTEPNPQEIISYIPGTIVKIFVTEGQSVKKGEALLLLEAMKMQNRVKMPFDGTVRKINVGEGDKIAKNTLLIEIA